jgi:hypothetical protein
MSDTQAFEVGQKVTILDVNKVGEVVSVSEDGTFVVKYTDDAGAEQTETVSADKLAAVASTDAAGEADEKSDEEEKSEEDGE